MKKLLALMAMLFLMLFVACQVSDTTDDTDTDIAVATLLNEAGLPVPNATVRVYTFRDSTGIPVDSTVTNANGSYELEASLTPGSYSLWAETDSSVLFREDLIIKTDSAFVDTNTLVSARKIWVPVKMHKDHDPRTVEAQIWGTPIRHNVSVEGFLILDKITTGTYFTRLTTTLEGYTPTNDSFTITALSPDTLLDTLELIYTGLPRVVVGSVVLSDGTPAVNATVRVFPYRDSTGLWVDSLLVDAEGNFETKQLVAGRYSLWIESETEMSFREDIVIAENEKTMVTDTLKSARKIWVPVKVQPNHTPQMVEAQLWGTPIQQNVSSDGYLELDKIAAGSYFTRLNTTLDGYVATNDTIAISVLSPDTLTDTLELIYTSIPVVTGLAYTYDTLITVVNLTWDQSSFNDIQAYVIERKLKSETVWPAMPLANVYVNQMAHPTVFNDTLSEFEAGAIYQYRIKIIDNSSLAGMPFGVLEVNAVSAFNVVTTITATSMQKAKAIVGNRASINDVMSFTVNFSNPTRKLTQLEWYEGEGLLKTTPLTELITSDFFEKSWPTIGAKNLTVKITDDAGFVWVKDIPVSIVEDKPVISFVDTTINLNVLDTLTAVVSDEFGEVVSYQWDWGNDGTIDATTPQFVFTNDEIVGDYECKLLVTDDDGNVTDVVNKITSKLIWDKVSDIPSNDLVYETKEHQFEILGQLFVFCKEKNQLWKTNDGLNWQVCDNEFIPLSSKKNFTKLVVHSGSLYYLEYNLLKSDTCVVSLQRTSDLKEWEILVQRKFVLGTSGYFGNYPVLFSYKEKLYSNVHNFPDGLVNTNLSVNLLESVDGKSWHSCTVAGYSKIGLYNESREYETWNFFDDAIYQYEDHPAIFLRITKYNSDMSEKMSEYGFYNDDKNPIVKLYSSLYLNGLGSIYKEAEGRIIKVSDIYGGQFYHFLDKHYVMRYDGIYVLRKESSDTAR